MYQESLKTELETMSVRAGGPPAVAAAAAADHSVARAVMVEDGEGGDQPQHPPQDVVCELNGERFTLRNGAVVIAAITSCTQTSNPSVMLAAGMLARNAVRAGLKTKPWVKTSLAPGSKVVTEYYRKAGLLGDLALLGFNIVGYGCTTCIGNSGPLPQTIADAVERHKLVVAAVLSGNRNFEGRINPLTRFNYLASPPLVVAYALAGRMDIDLGTEPLGIGSKGPVFLRDIWPAPREVEEEILRSVKQEMFRDQYADVFAGDERWQGLTIPTGDRYAWAADSTYVKNPPYFEGMTLTPPGVVAIAGARALAMLGDSITTDHISPAGSIPAKSPAGEWLLAHGVSREDFNSYGARRGNHEVMVRGTFANIRLRNEIAPGTEGGWTRTDPAGKPVTIYECVADLRQGRHAAPDHRRQGVWHRLIARLGSQGNATPWRPGGHRRSRRSAFTDRTSSGWVCCRSSSWTARRVPPSRSAASKPSTSMASPTRSRPMPRLPCAPATPRAQGGFPVVVSASTHPSNALLPSRRHPAVRASAIGSARLVAVGTLTFYLLYCYFSGAKRPRLTSSANSSAACNRGREIRRPQVATGRAGGPPTSDRH